MEINAVQITIYSILFQTCNNGFTTEGQNIYLFHHKWYSYFCSINLASSRMEIL